jgi:hypothetical protein
MPTTLSTGATRGHYEHVILHSQGFQKAIKASIAKTIKFQGRPVTARAARSKNSVNSYYKPGAKPPPGSKAPAVSAAE